AGAHKHGNTIVGNTGQALPELSLDDTTHHHDAAWKDAAGQDDPNGLKAVSGEGDPNKTSSHTHDIDARRAYYSLDPTTHGNKKAAGFAITEDASLNAHSLSAVQVR